jgi:hypothetical protein
MKKPDIGIDKMIDLFEAVYDHHKADDTGYDLETDQPTHFSWIHIWCSKDGLATDTTTGVCYKDAEEFQQHLMNTVRAFFNTETLQCIIDGDITMFGMQIGPEQPGGGNLNDELGIEVSYE